MARGIRRKEGEDFSDQKIQHVITELEKESPITKKAACEILNITYNPARLTKIINKYKEDKAYAVKRRKELRTVPLTKGDISFILSSYLETGNLSEISEITFRSLSVIKSILAKNNIPLRDAKSNYFNPPVLSEESIANDYEKDDLVYSARYTQPAKISKRFSDDAYRLWLCHDEQYAIQPYWELGDLRTQQKEYNLDIKDKKWAEDILPEIAKARANARKRKKDE